MLIDRQRPEHRHRQRQTDREAGGQRQPAARGVSGAVQQGDDVAAGKVQRQRGGEEGHGDRAQEGQHLVQPLAHLEDVRPVRQVIVARGGAAHDGVEQAG